MVDAIPFYEDGDELTATATAAVTGKTFVRISGDKQADGSLSVAPAGAGALAIGVAMYDAAVGQKVTIHTINSGHVMPVTAGAAALAAGARVASDAGAHAVAAGAGAPALGVVLTGAPANGDAMVSLSYCTG
jgi:predicted RecA/RadA family phage recombinase